MRIATKKYDGLTGLQVDGAETIEETRIVWRGQHFFIYEDEQWEDVGDYVPLYMVTHIGTGLSVFPGTPHLDRLIEISAFMDTWGSDWGALRRYSRDRRIAGHVEIEMPDAVSNFKALMQPYWMEVYEMNRYEEEDEEEEVE